MKLDFLDAVAAHEGPWASVYATTGPPDESSAERRELTWRELCRSLGEQGADEATVGAVREALDRSAPADAPHGLALFAADGQVDLSCRLGRDPGMAEAHWGPLPRVTPLLELAGQAPPCLVVRVDRSGADYRMYDGELSGSGSGSGSGGRSGAGAAGSVGEGSVQGRDWPLHQASSGDWSSWHFDAAVENTWQENAAHVATELARIFPASGAELMMLAGGARECRGVLEQLPAELRHVTRISRHGGRAPGADTALLTADVEAARLESTALGVEAALERFRAGRGESAVAGVPAVTEAAREHRLDTLLISPAGADPRTEIWVGDEPDQVAVRRTDAERLGVGHPQQARADDALVRCAVATGGEAVLVPTTDTVAGGIGALLRWPRSPEEAAAHH